MLIKNKNKNCIQPWEVKNSGPWSLADGKHSIDWHSHQFYSWELFSNCIKEGGIKAKSRNFDTGWKIVWGLLGTRIPEKAKACTLWYLVLRSLLKPLHTKQKNIWAYLTPKQRTYLKWKDTQHQASPGQYKAAGWDTGIKFLQKKRMTGFRRCYLINELLRNGTWISKGLWTVKNVLMRFRTDAKTLCTRGHSCHILSTISSKFVQILKRCTKAHVIS